ncbi:MAG: metallophosphoesterase [Bacillota bacterium]|nr:MAG: metallophosphoesterase [Bacillota bacterium]
MVKVLAILIVIALISAAFYSGLIVRRYSIETDKIPKGHSIRIVLVSDLHCKVYGKDQSKIKRMIKAENPDIIALAGDIVDKTAPIEGAKLFLEAIKDMAPIYYVTGNHEIKRGEVHKIKELFKSYGVNVLENSMQKVNIRGVDLIVAGADDPGCGISNWYKEICDSFLNLKDAEEYKILLSHRPEKADFYSTLPFDLVLSGHAHGGQVRIPFLLNGLYAPHQGLFPKYAGGLYEFENYTLIVSRGAYSSLFLPRIFNPPEIVVIDIEGIR